MALLTADPICGCKIARMRWIRVAWSTLGAGAGADLNKTKLFLPGLFVALRSCFVIDCDQSSPRINKGVGASKSISVSCFVLGNVNLILVLSNFVLKVIFCRFGQSVRL